MVTVHWSLAPSQSQHESWPCGPGWFLNPVLEGFGKYSESWFSEKDETCAKNCGVYDEKIQKLPFADGLLLFFTTVNRSVVPHHRRSIALLWAIQSPKLRRRFGSRSVPDLSQKVLQKWRKLRAVDQPCFPQLQLDEARWCFASRNAKNAMEHWKWCMHTWIQRK